MLPRKPKLPDKARLLNAGEKIENGDLRWLANKWQPVAATIGGRIVLQRDVGFYCRKTR
jgi:hypothetical protein